MRKYELELTEDEFKLLSEQREYLQYYPAREKKLRVLRCPECSHLAVLHNDHCCSFCTVPGCKCENAPY